MNGWSTSVGWYTSKTAWLYSGISAIHYFTLFIMVGTAVDRLAGAGTCGDRKASVKFAEQVYPWMWGAFWLAVLSGVLMAATDAGDYLPDTVFETKMSVIVLAVIFHDSGAAQHSQVGRTRRALPAGAKVLAVLSLIFWMGSILAGVEIAAISGSWLDRFAAENIARRGRMQEHIQTTLMPLSRYLQMTSWATAIRTSLWAYPFIQLIHFSGLSLWLGPTWQETCACWAWEKKRKRPPKYETNCSYGIGSAFASRSSEDFSFSARATMYIINPAFRMNF